MNLDRGEPIELRDLGSHLSDVRLGRGLSQAELATRCGLSQAQISYFELGQRRPALDQLLRIAKALDCSIERLLGGSDRPGTERRHLAVELRSLGIADLWIGDAVVPGAFRRAEELIPMAIAGEEPDPRIVEAIPAVLSWNEIDPVLLRSLQPGDPAPDDVAAGLAGGRRPGDRPEWRVSRRMPAAAARALHADRPRRGDEGRCLGQPGPSDGEAADLADLEAMEDQLRRRSA